VRTREIWVVEPGRVELLERELDERLAPHEILVEAEVSIVSAGTEGAAFTGLEREMPRPEPVRYPIALGYGHLGRVLAVGSDVTACRPGDRVLTFSRHASVAKADARWFALPEGELPGTRAVFARMAGVAIAALRSSTVQAGDTVLVIGAGLVGNLAAQLFALAGADVLIADLAEPRLAKAREVGIPQAVSAAEGVLEEAVAAWTGGRGAHAVVEALGKSKVVARAVRLARRHGEVILLGSPRARATFDVTPMLTRIHLEALRMIGALEWRWPMHEVERGRALVDNYRLLLRWIADGRLRVEPLLTHRFSPAACQEAYELVTGHPEACLGVVFDWSQLR
jgi:threonine dehydrogenase-like Zn-dependent dehydrogenase